MSQEYPVKQVIREICLCGQDEAYYEVGRCGVTRIESMPPEVPAHVVATDMGPELPIEEPSEVTVRRDRDGGDARLEWWKS